MQRTVSPNLVVRGVHGRGPPELEGWWKRGVRKRWDSLHQKALERDNYRCVVCGKPREEIGRNPDVHHIVPVRWFVESKDHDKEEAHRLENVVSLCVECHRKADFGKISEETLRESIEGAN